MEIFTEEGRNFWRGGSFWDERRRRAEKVKRGPQQLDVRYGAKIDQGSARRRTDDDRTEPGHNQAACADGQSRAEVLLHVCQTEAVQTPFEYKHQQ